MLFFKKKGKKSLTVSSHIDGSIIGLERVPDEVFSARTLGDGFAVLAAGSTVKAPVDGTVAFLAETKHAVGIIMDNNVQVLIHIGLDSAATVPENFQVLVKEGQIVHTGDVLVEISPELLENPLYIPLVIVENPDSAVYAFTNLNTDASAGTEVIQFK